MKPHDDSIFVVDIDIRSDGEDLRIQGDGAAYAGSGLPWLIQKRRRGDALTFLRTEASSANKSAAQFCLPGW